MTSKEKELKEIIAPAVQKLGYTLYDVEYLKEVKDWFLRIYIAHPEKIIDLDDCEKVSNAVSEELDIKDPIESSYSLEVSSCGLEPKLREKEHFLSAVGKNIEVKLFKPLEKEKIITGVLESVNDTGIIVNQETSEKIVGFDNIASAKIIYDWEESENG